MHPERSHFPHTHRRTGPRTKDVEPSVLQEHRFAELPTGEQRDVELWLRDIWLAPLIGFALGMVGPHRARDAVERALRRALEVHAGGTGPSLVCLFVTEVVREAIGCWRTASATTRESQRIAFAEHALAAPGGFAALVADAAIGDSGTRRASAAGKLAIVADRAGVSPTELVAHVAAAAWSEPLWRDLVAEAAPAAELCHYVLSAGKPVRPPALAPTPLLELVSGERLKSFVQWTGRDAGVVVARGCRELRDWLGAELDADTTGSRSEVPANPFLAAEVACLLGELLKPTTSIAELRKRFASSTAGGGNDRRTMPR